MCISGDFVILGTDGVIDNFDPFVTRLAVPKSPKLDFVDEDEDSLENQYVTMTTANLEEQNENSNNDNEENNTSMIYLSKESINQTTARSWLRPIPLAPPPQLSIWPKPPAPPSQTYNSSSCLKSSNSISSLLSNPSDVICASQINFVDHLELDWSERCQYTIKQLENVWQDLIKTKQLFSSKDLCTALIKYVYKVTSRRRELLEDVELIKFHTSTKQDNDFEEKTNSEFCVTKQQRKWFSDIIKRLPGKLDHATTVVYEIGVYKGNDEIY